MAGVDILEKLSRIREKHETEAAEMVLKEVNKILSRDLYNDKNVLHNLKNYNRLNELVNEEDVEQENIFHLPEIKAIALKYRLRFIDSQNYRFDFPYEAVLKIDFLNQEFKKSLKGFKILGTSEFFKNERNNENALLFAPTSNGNYYLVHRWGRPLRWHRALSSWPLMNIENLLLTILFVTLAITLSLPTELLSLDRKATYWCGWRIGVFFHLLIFNMGVTAYFTFAFGRNLTSTIWNSDSDFV